jgi:proton-coupled amino acid transporter
MARLQASGADGYYGSSPTHNSIHSFYGGTHDLTQVPSHQSVTSNYSIATNHDDNKLARAVKRHLVDPASSSSSSVVDMPSSYANSLMGGDDVGSVQSGSTGNNNTNHYTNSIHQLPGASVTHDIYKWTDNVDDQQARKKRSQSFIIHRNEPSDPALARLKDPGGFRRHFVVDKAVKQGKAPPHWMTRTFVEFLALYGHFGGEDLSEDEDDDEDEDDPFTRHRHSGDGDERTPLIRRPSGEQQEGNVTSSKAVLLLIKAFFGTGKEDKKIYDIG